ncbi:MAG: hypothetical protein OEW87_10065 [Flavobacteriaceae bacterium]|nr:hypothetical protein [Flavobacteriaceae bacterium]
MKILFVINNTNACYTEYQHTGTLNAPKRRSIEIKLTEEQINKIGLMQTETVESTSVLLENKN